MPLELGRSFDRSYSIRVPFLDGYYNITTFFHKSSNFLLFRVDPDFKESKSNHGIKINMFKNLETSKFCETFIDLHNYRGDNLDISNQFNKIKDDYFDNISFTFNESIILAKHKINNKDVYSNVMFYGLTLSAYEKEYLFIIAERQHIILKLQKKIVRTTGVQCSTSSSLDILDQYYKNYHADQKLKLSSPPLLDSTKIIKLE